MPNKITIEHVCEPVIRDLTRVQRNIRREIKTANRVVNKIVARLLDTRGKLLRPALALLAARAVERRGEEAAEERMIQLATAIELVHDASMVHDDINDDSTGQRAFPTISRLYNKHIALLAGDALYAKAFFLMSHHLPKEIIEPITLVTAGMCHGEILMSVRDGELVPFDTYLTVARLKTAALMSVSTQTGAMVMGADDRVVQAMADYGMNAGIAYRLVEDYVEESAEKVEDFSLDRAIAAADCARAALDVLPAGIYRDRLLLFLEVILAMAEEQEMSVTVRLP